MAYRSLRSTSSFFRHPNTAFRKQPLPLSPSICLQSISETKNSQVCLYYSQPVRNVNLNSRGHASTVFHHPQLTYRSFSSPAAALTPETDAKLTTEPPSGGTEHDSSSSSSSDDSSDGSDDSSSNDESFDSVDSIRLAVLDASVEFVHEHGWSEQAIAAGAESLGYSSMTHGLVEGGGGELFTHLQRRLNEDLEVELQRLRQQGEDHPHSKLNKSAFVEAALKHRLGLIVPYLAVWSRGLVMVAMSPSTAQQGLHNIATLADHVCHYSGDISISADWYAKRAAVALVYKAAELSLLQDKSPDYEDTWQFLHRRVTEVVGLEKTLDSLESVAEEAAKLACAALYTSFNMLGMNSKSR